jgi:hypothetical protein
MSVYAWGNRVGLRPLLPAEMPWPDRATPQYVIMGYPTHCMLMQRHLMLPAFNGRRVIQIHPHRTSHALRALRGVQFPQVILVEGCQDCDPEVWDSMYMTRPIRIEGDPSYGEELPSNWVRFKVDIVQATPREKPGPLVWP